jgi:hypothetical protein
MAKQVDKGLGVPVINDIYDWVVRKSVSKTAEADAVICVSNFTKKEAVKLLGRREKSSRSSHGYKSRSF